MKSLLIFHYFPKDYQIFLWQPTKKFLLLMNTTNRLYSTKMDCYLYFSLCKFSLCSVLYFRCLFSKEFKKIINRNNLLRFA